MLLDDGGGGGNLVQPLLPTNADGQAVGTYSHSNPGTYAISATADGIGIQQTASVIVDLPIIPDGG